MTTNENQISEQINEIKNSSQKLNEVQSSSKSEIKVVLLTENETETISGTQKRIQELNSINYIYQDEIQTAKEILELNLKNYTPNDEDNLTLHNFLFKTLKQMENMNQKARPKINQANIVCDEFGEPRQEKMNTKQIQSIGIPTFDAFREQQGPMLGQSQRPSVGMQQSQNFRDTQKQIGSYFETVKDNSDYLEDLNEIVLKLIYCKKFMALKIDKDHQYVQNLIASNAKYLSAQTLQIFIENIQDLKTINQNDEVNSCEYCKVVKQIQLKIENQFQPSTRNQFRMNLRNNYYEKEPEFSKCELLKTKNDKLKIWQSQRTNKNVFHFMKLNIGQFQYVLSNEQILHQDSAGIYAISDMCLGSIDTELKTACSELNTYVIQLLNVIKQISNKEAQKQTFIFFIKITNYVSFTYDNGCFGYILDNLESVFENKELLKEILLTKFDDYNILHLILKDKADGDIFLKGYTFFTPQVNIQEKAVKLCKRLGILPQLITLQNNDGQTPLMMAVDNNYFNIDLLADGDMSVDIEGNNILHYYINYFVLRVSFRNQRQSWPKILNDLMMISQKVDITKLLQQENKYCYTPVHLGSQYIEMLQFFDDHKVNFQKISQTYLIFNYNSGESLKFLLDKGCDLLQVYGNPEFTPLKCLAYRLTTQDVEVIIQHGYDQTTVTKILLLYGNIEIIRCILDFNIEPSLSLTQTFFLSFDYDFLEYKNLIKQLAEKLQVDAFDTEQSLIPLLSRDYIDNSVFDLICYVKNDINLDGLKQLSLKIKNINNTQNISSLLKQCQVVPIEEQVRLLQQITKLTPYEIPQDLIDQLVSTFVYANQEQHSELKYFVYNLIKNIEKSKLELAFSKIISFKDEDLLLKQLLQERDLSLKHHTLKMPETFYLVPNERDYELMDNIKNNRIYKPKLNYITPLFSSSNSTMYYKDIPCHVIGFKEENNLIQVMDIEIVVYFHGIEVRTIQTCISPKIHSYNVQQDLQQCRPYITLFEHGSENQAFQFFLGIIYQNTNQNLEQIVTEQDETYSSGFKFNIKISHHYDIDQIYSLDDYFQSGSRFNHNFMLSLLRCISYNFNTFESVIKYKDIIERVEKLSIGQLKSIYIKLSSFESYPINLTRLELINFVKGSISQAVTQLRIVRCLHKYPIDDKLPSILLNELGFKRTSMDLCGIKISVLTKMPIINPFDYLQLNDERTSLIIQFMEHPSQNCQIYHSQIVGVGMAFAILDGKGNKTPMINKVLQMDYRFLDAGVIAFVE
ncbi:Conserved_hypothetical protein [Hexamita inflata]|uniref:Uncharacterized protein n=1 Tax=Hexamita inflata TaxID=28002 RepID=A0AA86N6J6_9EUKA|nr:Conserved hypothetical protein [Hexamita inflata]